MRENKFRAWDLELGEMVYFSLRNPIDIAKTYKNEHGIFVDRYVVMQYTGPKDERGTLIYEGDVIEWLDPLGRTTRAQVIYDDTTASYKTHKGELSHISIRPQLKVIGNIYENPELLEETNE